MRTGRHYAGFDTDAGYLALADERIAAERHHLADGRLGTTASPVFVPLGRGRPGASLDELVRAGERATAVARRMLVEAGFTHVESPAVFKDLGVTVAYRARDHRGQPWLFEVCGAFSSTRPGLARRDVLLRTIGTATVLAAARTAVPVREDLGTFVVLSTDTPTPRSPAGRTLAAVCGPGRVIHDVITLLSLDDHMRLRELAQGAPQEVPAP